MGRSGQASADMYMTGVISLQTLGHASSVGILTVVSSYKRITIILAQPTVDVLSRLFKGNIHIPIYRL